MPFFFKKARNSSSKLRAIANSVLTYRHIVSGIETQGYCQASFRLRSVKALRTLSFETVYCGLFR